MDKNSLALLLSFISSSFFFFESFDEQRENFFRKGPSFFLACNEKMMKKSFLPRFDFTPTHFASAIVNPQNYKDMYSFSTFSSFTGKSLTGPSNGTCAKVHVLVKLFLIYLYVFSSILLARRGCQGRSFRLT